MFEFVIKYVARNYEDTMKIINELSQEFGLITFDPLKHEMNDLIDFLLSEQAS